MAKGRTHLKKLRSEKAKVKLKGSKKLKKADNVTDTSFKIKQIVVREQLKASNTAQPLSNRKLNIKDLLSRLQHYNSSVRNDGIIGLKEIVSLYPEDVIVPNLSQLLHGVLHLVLDKEKTIRRDVLKLITLILTPVSNDQINPFFDILCSYLRCAMTHIDLYIQEDSLLFLDILLKCVPSLVALNFDKILPNFFDLISKLKSDFNPGRTLTINLGSKMTSIKWRIKVLNAFQDILMAIIIEKKQTKNFTKNNGDVKMVKFNPEEKNYISLYTSEFKKITTINLDQKSSHSEFSTSLENNMVKYIEIMVPLLFETWLEVGPNKSETSSIDFTLTSETFEILSCLTKILQMLWEFIILYEKECGNREISNKFITKYGKNFTGFVVKNFPYTQIVVKKRKRNESKRIITQDCMCTFENLSVCYMFCIFNKKFNEKIQNEYAEGIIKYVTTCFENKRLYNKEIYQQLLLVFQKLLELSDCWSKYGMDISRVVEASVKFYKSRRITEHMRYDLFYVLSGIINMENLNKSSTFQVWLSTLPGMLCQKEISEKIINITMLLGKQKNSIFIGAFLKKLSYILNNLEDIKILDNEDKYLVINNLIQTFFWLPIFKGKNLETLKEYIVQSKDMKIKQSLIDLLKMRYDLKEERSVYEALNSIDSFDSN